MTFASVAMTLRQMVPDRTPTQRLAEVLLGEDIEAWVLARRAEGLSYRRIAQRLCSATDGQIDVTYETLRSWLPEPEDVAS